MASGSYLSAVELEAGLPDIRLAPKDRGRLDSIVRRPQIGEREVLEEGRLDLIEGLVGDNYVARGSSQTEDGSSHPNMQVTIMSSRVIDLVAKRPNRWQLAGDQLFIDLDLSVSNLPPGTQLVLGEALLEVSEQPHTGCKKFAQRFGVDAARFVNSLEGKKLRLRGLNARVVRPGSIWVGQVVSVSRAKAQTRDKAVFQSVSPYQQDALNLPVRDLDQAVPYYETVMGFRMVSRQDSPCKSAILRRDDVQIGLAENGGDPTQDGCFFEVDDVEAAFDELKSNGLDKVDADYRVDQHGDISYRVFFVVAPDDLCYCIGQRQQ